MITLSTILSRVAGSEALLGTASPTKPLVPYVLYFLLVSLVIAFVSSAIRLKKPRDIAAEATRFFIYIVLGILIFCTVVFLLEWLFVRSLI